MKNKKQIDELNQLNKELRDFTDNSYLDLDQRRELRNAQSAIRRVIKLEECDHEIEHLLETK